MDATSGSTSGESDATSTGSGSTGAFETTGGSDGGSGSTSTGDASTGSSTAGDTGSSTTGEALAPFEYCPAVFVDVWPDRTTIRAWFTDGCGGPPVDHPPGERVSLRVDGSAGHDLTGADEKGTTVFEGEAETPEGSQLQLVVIRPDDSEHAVLFDVPAPVVVTAPLSGARLPQGNAFAFNWETGNGPFVGWQFSWEYVDDGGMTVSSPPNGEALPDEDVGSGTVYAAYTSPAAPHDVDGVLSIEREAYGTMTLGETYPGGFSIVRAITDVPVILEP